MVQRYRQSSDLFDQNRGEIPGFSYQPDLFTEGEEQSFIAQFGKLDVKPFDFHGFKGNRRVVSFGWRFDYGASVLREAEPFPVFLEPLREIAARFAQIPAAKFQTALVTEYAPGAGIGWHRDKPMFRDVAAFSFLAPCRLRLRRRNGVSWQRHVLPILPRSIYLLQGEVREAWEHSIPSVTALRYSVTFRTFKPGHGGVPANLTE